MKRVLITGARAPVALHLARLFDASGCEVIMADTLSRPLAGTSGACSRYFRLPVPDRHPREFAGKLAAVLDRHDPDLVIPTCEEVFYLAWAFEAFGLGGSLFAPSFARLRRAHNKALFAEDAKAFGLDPPDTRVIASHSDLAALRPDAGGLVFKPVWSRFASTVLVRPGQAKLDRIELSPSAPWIAQAYVPGEEICCYAIARNGRLLGSSAYRPIHRAGTGAGIYFEPVRDEQVAGFCAAYVAATDWTGQISFDFRRDEAGRLRVLECNPRTTSGVHFYGPQADLPAAVGQGRATSPTTDRPLMIPAAMVLFGLPTALRRLRLAGWWRDMVRGRNALHWPGDRLSLFAEPRALAELAAIAVRTRTSLIAASTAGIAWDGDPIGGDTNPSRGG